MSYGGQERHRATFDRCALAENAEAFNFRVGGEVFWGDEAQGVVGDVEAEALVALPDELGANVFLVALEAGGLPVLDLRGTLIRVEQMGHGDAGRNLGDHLVVVGSAELIDGEVPELGQGFAAVGHVAMAGEAHAPGVAVSLGVVVVQVFTERDGAHADRFEAFQNHDAVDGLQAKNTGDMGPLRTSAALNHFGKPTGSGAQQQVARAELGTQGRVVGRGGGGEFFHVGRWSQQRWRGKSGRPSRIVLQPLPSSLHYAATSR